jgi:hypothetical protein
MSGPHYHYCPEHHGSWPCRDLDCQAGDRVICERCQSAMRARAIDELSHEENAASLRRLTHPNPNRV